MTGGALLGDVLARCGLRLDMGVRDIAARLSLTDDDLAVLERVKGCYHAARGEVRVSDGYGTAYDRPHDLLDYLLGGEL